MLVRKVFPQTAETIQEAPLAPGLCHSVSGQGQGGPVTKFCSWTPQGTLKSGFLPQAFKACSGSLFKPSGSEQDVHLAKANHELAFLCDGPLVVIKDVATPIKNRETRELEAKEMAIQSHQPRFLDLLSSLTEKLESETATEASVSDLKSLVSHLTSVNATLQGRVSTLVAISVLIRRDAAVKSVSATLHAGLQEELRVSPFLSENL